MSTIACGTHGLLEELASRPCAVAYPLGPDESDGMYECFPHGRHPSQFYPCTAYCVPCEARALLALEARLLARPEAAY